MVSSSSKVKKPAETFHQSRGHPFSPLFARPFHEGLLRDGQGVLDAVDAEALREGEIAAFGDEVDLVAQILEVVVDRGGGKQHDLGFDAGLDDVFHQPLVTALPDDVAVFVALALGVVAEVVGFVDDDQVVVAPVEGGEIDAIHLAALA
jgi:hypothetical protein